MASEECFENACYFLGNEKMSWSHAGAYCFEMGGVLTSIHSLDENRFLSYKFGVGWIGLSDAENETFWKWDDGSQLDYVNWIPGQPDNYKGVEHYAFMADGYGGAWGDYSDAAQLYPICKKLTTQPTSQPTPTPTMTPTNAPSANLTSYPTTSPTQSANAESTVLFDVSHSELRKILVFLGFIGVFLTCSCFLAVCYFTKRFKTFERTLMCMTSTPQDTMGL